MADWPLIGEGTLVDRQTLLPSSVDYIVCSGGANVKGTYVTVVSAALFGATAMEVWLRAASNGQRTLVDLAIGAAGSEVVVVPNLLLDYSRQNVPFHILLPVAIASGTQVRARMQTYLGAGSARVGVGLYSQGFLASQPGAMVDAYGLTVSSTNATPVDPGSTIATKGAWTEITPGLLRAAIGLFVTIGNSGFTTMPAADRWLMDVGIGAGGAEQTLIPDILLFAEVTGDNVVPGVTPPYMVTLPTSTRIALRMASTTNSPVRTLNTAVYAVVG